MTIFTHHNRATSDNGDRNTSIDSDTTVANTDLVVIVVDSTVATSSFSATIVNRYCNM